MKAFIVLFALFAAAFAANDYAYLTYWTDDRCTNFVSVRAITDQNAPVSTATGNSCAQEMHCLLNPSGPDCLAIANENRVIRANIVSTGVVDEIVDDLPADRISSSDCIKSFFYTNCYFSYNTQNQVEDLYENNFGSCDSSPASVLVVPAIAAALMSIVALF
eukprot:TRINITY_DN1298_c0_g1_i1.p2 TRINITY_DN1298_c0_g1~~TRINITY_DN1298_c0_g1_i1.p2  ORF type:complete len:169 (-),score=57.83 TRINITY_DN1298_c0_g1_i1:65-550(-)